MSVMRLLISYRLVIDNDANEVKTTTNATMIYTSAYSKTVLRYYCPTENLKLGARTKQALKPIRGAALGFESV